MKPLIASTYVRVVAALVAALIVGYATLGTQESVVQLFAQQAVRWVAGFVAGYFFIGIFFIAGRSFLRLRREEETFHEHLAHLTSVKAHNAVEMVHNALRFEHNVPGRSLLHALLTQLTRRHEVDMAVASQCPLDAAAWTEDYRARVLRHVLKPLQNWSYQLFLLGIIFTFIGVCMALSNAQISWSAEEMREYIPTAMGGLGVAFISSIIAYCGSFCMRLVSNSFEHGIDTLCDTLTDVLVAPVLPVLSAELAHGPLPSVGDAHG